MISIGEHGHGEADQGRIMPGVLIDVGVGKE